MKKFVLKLLLYIFIVFAIIALLNARWQGTQAYLLEDEKFKTINPPKSIDICNVGSSHGMIDFNYDNLPEGYTGFNFGRPIQMFYYDLQMIKQNRKNLEKDCVVFIPISYFSYYQYFDEQMFLDKEYIYYNFLDYRYIKNKSFELALEYKWLSIFYIRQDQIKYLFKEDKQSIEDYDKVFEKSRFIDENTGEIDMERLIKERDKTVNQHAVNFSRGISQISIDKLKEMIEYCQKTGYKCVLITTPFSDIYNEAEVFDDSFFESFYSITDEISEEYDIPYWDYSHSDEFSEDLFLFYDDDHLNKVGTKLFSDIVINRAINEGYLKRD